MDMKLDVAIVPILDVDQAKRLHQTFGFRARQPTARRAGPSEATDSAETVNVDPPHVLSVTGKQSPPEDAYADIGTDIDCRRLDPRSVAVSRSTGA